MTNWTLPNIYNHKPIYKSYAQYIPKTPKNHSIIYQIFLKYKDNPKELNTKLNHNNNHNNKKSHNNKQAQIKPQNKNKQQKQTKTLNKQQKVVSYNIKQETLDNYIFEAYIQVKNYIDKKGVKTVYFPKISKFSYLSYIEKARKCLVKVLQHFNNAQLYHTPKNQAKKKILEIIWKAYPYATKKVILKSLGWEYKKDNKLYSSIMKELRIDRWTIIDKGIEVENRLNPFLDYIKEYNNEKWEFLLNYANYDLLDLFNFPFLQAKKEGIHNIKVYWYPDDMIPFKVYWNGIVFFKIETIRKNEYFAVLPYQVHWSGENPHVTIPLKHGLFDIETKKHIIENVWLEDGMIKIHFDFSLKLGIPVYNSGNYNNAYAKNRILRNIAKKSLTVKREVEKRKLHLRTYHLLQYNSEGKKYWRHLDFIERYWNNHDYVEFNNPEKFESVINKLLVNRKH